MQDLKISLAAARVNAKKTQEFMASEMRLSKSTIVNWEKGKIIPKPAQLKMFCDLCGIDVDNIFLG